MVVRWLPVVAVSRFHESFPSRDRVRFLIVGPYTVCLSGCEFKKAQVHQSSQGLDQIGVHPLECQQHSPLV